MEGESSRDVALEVEEVLGAPGVVPMCNRILAAAGVAGSVSSEEDVRIICSQTSVFVAACEAVLGKQMENINRRPLTYTDRSANIEKVLKAIASLLHTDLSHISGERVALGDMNDIRNLVEIMAALSFVRPREDSVGRSYISESLSEVTHGAEDLNASADSVSRPFLVKVNRGSTPPTKPRDQRDAYVVKEAQKAISALEDELGGLEEGVLGRRRSVRSRRTPVSPPQSSPPGSGGHIPKGLQEDAEDRRPARATPKFNAPRLRTANRGEERHRNLQRKKYAEMVGRPLDEYAGPPRQRGRGAVGTEGRVGKLSAEEKREAKIKESMERRKEGGGGMVQDPAARGMKPCLNLNVGKQSRKVKLAYAAVVNRGQPGFSRSSTPSKWHRRSKKGAKERLSCPYNPEDGEEAPDLAARGPPPAAGPEWDPDSTRMTEAMKQKLAGLQRMKHSEAKGTDAAARAMSLRELEETWRHSARKEIWLRQHWAERRKAVQDANLRVKLQQRSDRYNSKVEALRAERFKEQALNQRLSKKEEWANRDRRILREMFEEAVRLEKEKIIEDKKMAKEEAKAEVAKKGADRSDSYAEQQVQKNWALLREVLGSERQQRNIAEHGQDELVRLMDRDRGEAARELRMQHLARLASEEEAAYWRAAHPKTESEWFNRIWHTVAAYKA